MAWAMLTNTNGPQYTNDPLSPTVSPSHDFHEFRPMTDSPAPVTVRQEVLQLFRARGGSNYGKEAVTQEQHALQAAFFAERQGASPALITAALLHDVGHLLHDLPEDAPDTGIDDQHELLAERWLRERFAANVVEPAALHVSAKRYLCATDADYTRELSPPSVLSLKLQGGPMSPAEQADFEKRPYFRDAVALRRWDDAAKVVDLLTPDLNHYTAYIDRALGEK